MTPGSDIAHPHDRLLKTLLSDPERAGTLLREHLPKEIAGSLAPDPPELVEGTFVDEALRSHLTDRLFKVRTLQGRVVLLYVLIEHKSLPEPHIAWQLAKYLVEALKQWEREHPHWEFLPAIIPFVMYHGAAEWRIPDEFLSLVDAEEAWKPYLLNFHYALMDLGRIEDGELFHQPRLRAWLLAAKYAMRDGLQLGAKEVLIQSMIAIPEEDFRILMRYLVETFRNYDETTVREIIHRVRPEEEEEMMSQFAQEMMKRGRQQGWQEGRQEGRQEEAAAMLLKQLRRKFGQTPDWVSEKIGTSSLDLIEAWGENILFADSLEDVFSS
ncbi:MAG: Rpn family recombination-promoting nuclease/putative transposase [Magnetococcales bacterium]|nr:Rpn family recombination-promoting nuclease/putative transposase [Magnetococcales bacterium]